MFPGILLQIADTTFADSTSVSKAGDPTDLVAQVALFSLLPFVVAFAFIIFIFYRQNRESHLRKKQLELELKALRAQMNPHFMFNCLNSIYHTIKAGESEKAGEYLLKFSYLTRRVLENSSQRWIALGEDVQMLRAYLDLEQMRLANKFRYSIHVDPELSQENTSVLMLLAQPFVENSIWHGFHESISDPELRISINKSGNRVQYIIEDNGVEDAPRAETHPSKQASMGTMLVREQLKAIKEIEKGEAWFEMTNIKNEEGKYAGKRVELYLPLLSLH